MGRPGQVDRSIEVKFLADMKELVAASKATQQSLGGISGKSFQLNNVMGAVGQVIDVLAQARDVWWELGTAYSDYDQALGKSRAVFGKYSDAVERFSQTSAETWGQSRIAAVNYAGDIGNVFASLGAAKEEAAGFGVEALKLASDMSAFANLPIESALTAIRSGLVGETEPLRRFGIVVYDAAVKAKALEQGLWDGKGTMEESAKVTARWLLIQERAKNMTGSFAREVDTLQVQSQKLDAELANLKIQMGEGGIANSALLATKAMRGLVIVVGDALNAIPDTTGNVEDLSWQMALSANPIGAAALSLGNLAKNLAGVADDADKAAAAQQAVTARQSEAVQGATRVSTVITRWNELVLGNIEALKGQAAALNADKVALGQYLEKMGTIKSALNAAFGALKEPTLRETLKARYKDLTGKAFQEASKSSDPERRKAAELAAFTFGESLVQAGKKYKPTGNAVVDNWVKKGMDAEKAKKLIDKTLAQLQTYLTRNPIIIPAQVGVLYPLNPRSISRTGAGRSATGRSATSITVNVSGGDPQAVVRAIRNYAAVSGGQAGFERAIVR